MKFPSIYLFFYPKKPAKTYAYTWYIHGNNFPLEKTHDRVGNQTYDLLLTGQRTYH